MGGSAGCCSAATLTRAEKAGIDVIAPSSPSKPPDKFRSSSIYKSLYTEKSKVSKNSKVINVTSRDSGSEGQTFACRKVSLTGVPQKSIPRLVKHCQNMQSLEHPHICKFIECFQDTRELILIYEKADPKTLFDHVKDRGSLTEENASNYLRQAAMAMNVAHQANLYHGRLTPSKVLLAFKDDRLDEEDAIAQLKICDWGLTWQLLPDPVQAPSAKGVESMRYCVSPELAEGDLNCDEGDYPDDLGCSRNDVYALGCIMFHMLTGSIPFSTAGTQKMLLDSLAADPIKFDSTAWSKLSEECKNCIELMVKVNPNLRLTPTKLLQHPWIKIAKATFPKKRMVQLLYNLHENTKHCQFTRFVLRIIAEQLPPDAKQAETVEDAFRCLDSNGDGVLSVPELTKGLSRYLNLQEDDLNALFSCIDRDGSGTLNCSEFLAATMDQRRCLSTPVCWQAFNAFDKDQSGHVTFEEIDQIVKEIEGIQLGKDRLDTLCAQIRAELDSVSASKGSEKSLDFDQFVYLMQNTEPSKKKAFQKDMYRFCWNRCGLDCYQIRHVPPQSSWSLHDKPKKGDRSFSPRTQSVYRKKKHNERASDSPKGSPKGSPKAKEQKAQPAG